MSKKKQAAPANKPLSQAEIAALQALVNRYQPITVAQVDKVEREVKGFDFNLHKIQKAFIEDVSKYILICAGRRGGKTFGILVKLIQVCEGHKGAVCWFIGPTRERVKDILWDALKQMNEDFKLGMKFNNSTLEATFKRTKSVIKLRGCDEVHAANKFRGGMRNMLFVIDEAASFRDKVLEYLMREAIEPALRQFDGCQAFLMGTPGNTQTGFFRNADQRNNPSSKWKTYHFTVLDNCYYTKWVYASGPKRGLPFEDWQKMAELELKEVREENGWSLDNPIYQREYLGEWRSSESELYYLFNRQKNLVSSGQIPLGKLRFIIGIDVGTRVDPTAFIVIGYNEKLSSTTYVIEERTIEAPVVATKIYETAYQLQQQYNPELMVIDYAGAGDIVIQEINQRYGIYLEDAKKHGDKSLNVVGKRGITELMNGELFEGRLKISEDCKHLIDELQTVRFDDEKKKLDNSIPNDHCDALQYGWLKTYSYLFKKPEERRVLSHKERLDQELAAYIKKEDERIDREIEEQNFLSGQQFAWEHWEID